MLAGAGAGVGAAAGAAACASAGLLGVIAPAAALAQNAQYPNRPVTLIVPFPPGGPTDTGNRIVAERIGDALKQPFVIENRAGASGTVGATLAARAKPDGYTLLALATPTLLAPFLYPQFKSDVQKEFRSVGSIYDLPIVIVVNPRMLPDVDSLPKLIDKAKSSKPTLNYNTSGPGSIGHLTMEDLKQRAGFDMTHIAYKGGTPAIADLLAGQIPVGFADLVAALPFIREGRLRAIAIGSARRIPILPDLPSIAEQGFPMIDAVSWGGLLVPKGTPDAVISVLEPALKHALDDPGVQKRMEGAGTFAAFRSAADTDRRIVEQQRIWGKVIEDRKIKLE